MTALSDIFKRDELLRSEEAYRRLGYPRNPFRLAAGEDADEDAPFYTGHILQQLHQLRQWIADVREHEIRQPLALVGNIGTGKTRILRFLRRWLATEPPSQMVVAELVPLGETGL